MSGQSPEIAQPRATINEALEHWENHASSLSVALLVDALYKARDDLAQVTAERDDLLTAIGWSPTECPTCGHSALLHGIANPHQYPTCRGEGRETYETCGCTRSLTDVVNRPEESA